MTIALPILWAAIGAVWRRALGGWLGLRRSLLVALSVLSAVPTWFVLPPWQAAVVTGLSVLHWVDGHRFDRPWLLLGRYSYIPLAVLGFLWSSHYTVTLVADGFPAWQPSLNSLVLVAVGPLTAVVYTIARQWRVRPRGEFIDGWAAIGELGAGAAYWFALALTVI